MKVTELLEYKNKYYKPVPKKPKSREKKTLWYNNYDSWVADIKTRFPDALAYYDEENEEIIAGSGDSKECYGKWSKKKKDDYKGMSFYVGRNLSHVVRNINNLKQIKAKDAKKEERSSSFSALL